jgi:hypothetical protein
VILPPEAHPLVQALAPHFASPTYQRLSPVLVGAVLTTGRRTVADVLRTPRRLAPGHPTDYRRVLPRAPWPGAAVGCAPARFPLDRVVPTGPVPLVGDDTADGHPGRTVYGRGRRRAAVRSSRAYTAWRYGREWAVLAVRAQPPFAARRRAPPVLVDLDRAPEASAAEGARHRTPARLMCRPLRLVLLRFPGRASVFAGDSGSGTHEVARLCHRRRGRPARVSKRHPDINLFELPPPSAGAGRPRVKGGRVPKPREAAAARRARPTVARYGGGPRRVEAATGAGHRYKGGAGLVPVRWVFVRDATGPRRDEYPFTTDPAVPAGAVAGTCRGRWSIEATSGEARPALGRETTRGRCRSTVLRAGPCLPGLYSVVAALSHAPPESRRVGGVAWPGKAGVTFSDAMRAARRWLWHGAALPQAGDAAALAELPEPVRELLLTTLAPAA